MENSGRRGIGVVFRRKPVESDLNTRGGRPQLARRLTVFDLIAIGVGATIGAGVYILVGTVAREHTGPALTFSFMIAGIAAALSALCYSELACRCPSAGSAYHYSYICIGEGVAWLIGWSLILEFTLGGSAVARGISPNLALFFGGPDKLPSILARQTIYGIVVDPCASILVFLVTALLCTGIKESSLVQGTITTINIGAMLFIFIAGGYLGFKTGWAGYDNPNGYLPFGVNGLLAGSGTLFFSYVGFDCLTSTAEESKNPQRDLPLAIAISLMICGVLYMLVSMVIVGLVPYYALDPDTPISSAFAGYGLNWAVYIVTTGALTALCASLIGSILPQPRILMSMARDGLLPSFFSDINKKTRVPVKSTIVTGVFIALLAFFMDVSQLAGMVSVGTLLAFTVVAISILVLRYVPPDEVSVSSSSSLSPIESLSSQSDGYAQEINEEVIVPSADRLHGSVENRHNENSVRIPLLQLKHDQDLETGERRKTGGRCIAIICMGVVALTSAASAEHLFIILRLVLGGVGSLLLVGGLVVLTRTGQCKAKQGLDNAEGFVCPLVPYLPTLCILVNTYLLINIGGGTWIRVSMWLLVGVLIYVFYGRSHSILNENVNRVPIIPAKDS